jgi:two-component system, LytTR family, sensor kinase
MRCRVYQVFNTLDVIKSAGGSRWLPLLKYNYLKNKAILFHLLFWTGLYLLWIAVFRSYSVTLTKTITVEFCYLIFITAGYYIISGWVVPRLLLKKKYPLFVAATLLTITILAGLRAWVALQMNLHFFRSPVLPGFASLYLHSFGNIALWILLVTAGKMLAGHIQTQRQLELLEKERVKNELDYLKAQINPHALFNSLNTIYGHIDKSNQAARNILLQFSELLRYQLYHCNAEKVCLQKELHYIKNYVAFQQLRKEDTLAVRLQVKNFDNHLQIAPLLLIVLIENAFKFVSSFSDKKNEIIIKIYTEGGTLHCSFSNTKDAQQECGGTGGIGLTNLKRRLALLYAGRHELVTRAEKELYETHLTIHLT